MGKHPLAGRTQSDSHIRNRVQKLIGKKRTPEQCKRIGDAKRGKRLSPEAIVKRTETRRKNGWLKDPEKTKKLMSLNNAHARLGTKESNETRLKKAIALKGERNHNWKGGATKENERILKSAEYQIWREQVFKRDNYTCQFCGKRGGKIQADHIKPFALFPELRLDLENGRTLCVPCHFKTDTHGFRKMYRQTQHA